MYNNCVDVLFLSENEVQYNKSQGLNLGGHTLIHVDLTILNYAVSWRNPRKSLSAYGDAGVIEINDDDFASKARMFANHGSLRKHHYKFDRINIRLGGLQVAILSVKLPHIFECVEECVF